MQSKARNFKTGKVLVTNLHKFSIINFLVVGHTYQIVYINLSDLLYRRYFIIQDMHTPFNVSVVLKFVIES